MEAAAPFIFMALILVGGGFFIANAGKCTECGNLLHSFSYIKEVDVQRGEAHYVCKKCGYRHVTGHVRDDGHVVWFGGGSGQIDSDGNYYDHSHASGGHGGDSGGGDGGGSGE